jgi:hypothetical protein
MMQGRRTMDETTGGRRKHTDQTTETHRTLLLGIDIDCTFIQKWKCIFAKINLNEITHECVLPSAACR